MTADEFTRRWNLNHQNGNLLPHRDVDGVIFLWDEGYEGPPPQKAPPGRRVDPFGNVIQDQGSVTPFVPPPPVTPAPLPRDVRPGGFSQAFLPPLGAQREPRPSFFTPGAGVPAHPPATLPPITPRPPAPPPAPAQELPFGLPQAPPNTAPAPYVPPAGTSPPVPLEEKPSLLRQLGTFALLTAPAWGTFLYINRQTLLRKL